MVHIFRLSIVKLIAASKKYLCTDDLFSNWMHYTHKLWCFFFLLWRMSALYAPACALTMPSYASFMWTIINRELQLMQALFFPTLSVSLSFTLVCCACVSFFLSAIFGGSYWFFSLFYAHIFPFRVDVVFLLEKFVIKLLWLVLGEFVEVFAWMRFTESSLKTSAKHRET